MRILRGAAVFVLCAILSVAILEATLLLLSSGTATFGDILTGGLIFLPFVVVGGLVFGTLVLLTTDQKARDSVGRMMVIGATCGLLWSAIILFSFGAIVPRSLYVIAASSLAGAICSFVWVKLVEQRA